MIAVLKAHSGGWRLYGTSMDCAGLKTHSLEGQILFHFTHVGKTRFFSLIFYWRKNALQNFVIALQNLFSVKPPHESAIGMKLRHLLLGRKVMTNLESLLKSRNITLSTKVRLVKAMVFPVVMYGCESWTVKKAKSQRVDAFELWFWRRLFFFFKESLNCKEFQSVPSKGGDSWVFLGRNDAKAETPVLWPPHNKNWLIGKDCYAGRDWGQEEKGMTEDEMAGGHHRLDGHEFEWTPGVVDGQGGLACCTRLSNWIELNWE